MSPTLRVVSAPPASEPSTAGADDADVVPEASAASVPLVPPVAGAESPPHATRAAANVVISSTVRSLPISVLTSSDLFAGGSAARVTDPGSIAVTGRAAKPPRQAGRWHGFRTGGVPDPWHLEDRTPRSPRAGRWHRSRTGGVPDPWHLEDRAPRGPRAGRWHGFRTGGVSDPWHRRSRSPAGVSRRAWRPRWRRARGLLAPPTFEVPRILRTPGAE